MATLLNDRKQLFVKIDESVSTTVIRAVTTQGTVSSPNDFKLVINDLSFNTAYAKYVDDILQCSWFQEMSVTTHFKLVQTIWFTGHKVMERLLILTKVKN